MASKKFYLNIDYGEGKFYQYSKKPKNGYVKKESKTGKVSYRRYYDSIFGEIKKIEEKKNEFFDGNPMEIVLTVMNKDGIVYVVQFMSEKQNGDYSDFAESLIIHSKGLEKEKTYYIMPYKFEGKNGRVNTGFSIKENSSTGEKVEKLTYSYDKKEGGHVEGDIPAIVFKEKRGKIKADTEKKTDYLYDRFEELKELFNEEVKTEFSDRIPGYDEGEDTVYVSSSNENGSLVTDECNSTEEDTPNAEPKKEVDRNDLPF